MKDCSQIQKSNLSKKSRAHLVGKQSSRGITLLQKNLQNPKMRLEGVGYGAVFLEDYLGPYTFPSHTSHREVCSQLLFRTPLCCVPIQETVPLTVTITVLTNQADKHTEGPNPAQSQRGQNPSQCSSWKEVRCSSEWNLPQIKVCVASRFKGWLRFELPLISFDPEREDRDALPSPIYHSQWELCGQLPLRQAKFRRMKRSTK